MSFYSIKTEGRKFVYGRESGNDVRKRLFHIYAQREREIFLFISIAFDLYAEEIIWCKMRTRQNATNRFTKKEISYCRSEMKDKWWEKRVRSFTVTVLYTVIKREHASDHFPYDLKTCLYECSCEKCSSQDSYEFQ